MLENIENSVSQVNLVLARIGARLSLTESQAEVNSNILLQNQETLSKVRDIDYAEVITRVSSVSFALQASQQAYAMARDLYLFNFI